MNNGITEATLLDCNYVMPQPTTFVVGNWQRLPYNLPALTPAASDDPDAP